MQFDLRFKYFSDKL